MNKINKILDEIKLPKIIKVKQSFDDTKVDNINEKIKDELKNRKFETKIQKGQNIAITGGSRGISDYKIIMKTVVDFVKSQGAIPFIVPAMGSHGGGDSNGQKDILRNLCITEESMGCEVKSSMDVIEIGRTDNNLPVYIDKNAYNADGIILINRIKPHTSFRGRYESGLVKMLAIGLGKRKGADTIHSLRFENMAQNIEQSARVSINNLNILFGVATIENAYNQIAELHILDKDEIIDKEPKLLKKANEFMGKLYIKDSDILIVKEIGKSISGTGMDTNIIGRYHTKAASGGPQITKIGILDINKSSNGNANGMGLADFISKRFYDKIDFPSTYINAITSTEPNSIKLPMVLDSDEHVLKACAKTCGVLNHKDIKLIIIQNTKELNDIYMSKSCFDSINNYDMIQKIGDYFEIEFDESGNIVL